jgi:hypothetical protein
LELKIWEVQMEGVPGPSGSRYSFRKRTRKSPADGGSDEPLAEEGTLPTPPKRKRGRPPKTAKPPHDSEAEKPKGKVGRPPKLSAHLQHGSRVKRRNAPTELMDAAVHQLEKIPKEG